MTAMWKRALVIFARRSRRNASVSSASIGAPPDMHTRFSAWDGFPAVRVLVSIFALVGVVGTAAAFRGGALPGPAVGVSALYCALTGCTLTGQQVFSGVTTDITTGTNEDLTISPNGTGAVVAASTAGSEFRAQDNSASGFSTYELYNSAGVIKGTMGYGNASTAAPYTAANFFNNASGVEFEFLHNGVIQGAYGSVGFHNTNGSTNCNGIGAASWCFDSQVSIAPAASSATIYMGAPTTSTYATINLYDSADVLAGYIGTAGSAADADVASKIFMYSSSKTLAAIRGDDVAAGTVAFEVRDNSDASGVQLCSVDGAGNVFLNASATRSKTTCTLNAASPSVCTATVAASSICTCAPVGTTAAIAAAGCAVSLSSTTLTVTSANGLSNVVNIQCW